MRLALTFEMDDAEAQGISEDVKALLIGNADVLLGLADEKCNVRTYPGLKCKLIGLLEVDEEGKPV